MLNSFLNERKFYSYHLYVFVFVLVKKKIISLLYCGTKLLHSLAPL